MLSGVQRKPSHQGAHDFLSPLPPHVRLLVSFDFSVRGLVMRVGCFQTSKQAQRYGERQEISPSARAHDDTPGAV